MLSPAIVTPEGPAYVTDVASVVPVTVQASTWHVFGQLSPSAVLPSSQVSPSPGSMTWLPQPGGSPGRPFLIGVTHWASMSAPTPAAVPGHAPLDSALVNAVERLRLALSRHAWSTGVWLHVSPDTHAVHVGGAQSASLSHFCFAVTEQKPPLPVALAQQPSSAAAAFPLALRFAAGHFPSDPVGTGMSSTIFDTQPSTPFSVVVASPVHAPLASAFPNAAENPVSALLMQPPSSGGLVAALA